MQANYPLDLPFASRLYTEAGVLTLRKARNYFLAALVFMAIATVIIAASGGFHFVRVGGVPKNAGIALGNAWI